MISNQARVGPATCTAAAGLARAAVEALSVDPDQPISPLHEGPVHTPEPGVLAEAARMLRAAADLVDPPRPGVRGVRGGRVERG